MRIYDAVSSDEATRLFETCVRPVHEKLGATLVGRWRTGDDRTVVIWSYDSEDECERILAAAAADPLIVDSKEARLAAGLAKVDRVELYMTPTVEI